MRAILGILFVLLGGYFLLQIFKPEQSTSSDAVAFVSSAQCKQCHAQAYEEWDGSQHSISWTNPRVKALSNDFANQDCIACHAPRPVFETGVGERVLPRSTRRIEGVDCLSCHQLPGGGMAGTITDPRAACRPVASMETMDLARPDFCAACHNQHKTVDQWRESEWPDRDKDCMSCHMPYRNNDPNQGRDHRFLGGNHLPMLKQAVELRGSFVDGAWVVELENVGAGHAFPTDERSRRADVFWRPLGPDGARPDWIHLWRIRDPYRTETDIPSTLLHAQETKVLPIDAALSEASIEVALFYRREPYWADPAKPDPDRESTLVHLIQLSK